MKANLFCRYWLIYTKSIRLIYKLPSRRFTRKLFVVNQHANEAASRCESCNSCLFEGCGVPTPVSWVRLLCDHWNKRAECQHQSTEWDFCVTSEINVQSANTNQLSETCVMNEINPRHNVNFVTHARARAHVEVVIWVLENKANCCK